MHSVFSRTTELSGKKQTCCELRQCSQTPRPMRGGMASVIKLHECEVCGPFPYATARKRPTSRNIPVPQCLCSVTQSPPQPRIQDLEPSQCQAAQQCACCVFRPHDITRVLTCSRVQDLHRLSLGPRSAGADQSQTGRQRKRRKPVPKHFLGERFCQPRAQEFTSFVVSAYENIQCSEI